jgi:hypothetical protein
MSVGAAHDKPSPVGWRQNIPIAQLIMVNFMSIEPHRDEDGLHTYRYSPAFSGPLSFLMLSIYTVRQAFQRGVASGALIQVKGCFKLGAVAKPTAKSATQTSVKAKGKAKTTPKVSTGKVAPKLKGKLTAPQKLAQQLAPVLAAVVRHFN